MGPYTYLLYCYGPYFPIFSVFPNVTALVLSYTIFAPTTCELCFIGTMNMSHIVKVMRTWKRQQTCRTRRSWCSSSPRLWRGGTRWTGTRWSWDHCTAARQERWSSRIVVLCNCLSTIYLIFDQIFSFAVNLIFTWYHKIFSQLVFIIQRRGLYDLVVHWSNCQQESSLSVLDTYFEPDRILNLIELSTFCPQILPLYTQSWNLSLPAAV